MQNALIPRELTEHKRSIANTDSKMMKNIMNILRLFFIFYLRHRYDQMCVDVHSILQCKENNKETSTHSTLRQRKKSFDDILHAHAYPMRIPDILLQKEKIYI